MTSEYIDVKQTTAKLLKHVFSFKKHALGALLIGMLAGFVYTYLTPPKYKSNMVGVSSILNTEDIYPIINKVKTLLKDQNFKEIQHLLPLSETALKNIKDIAVTSEIIDSKNTGNIQIKNKFNIEITVTDYAIFDSLNKFLPEYIRNNKYTKIKNELVSRNQKLLYEKLGNEINMLDSVKYEFYKFQNRGNNAASVYMNNPSGINESIIKLFEQRLAVYETLMLSQDFLVIEDFVTVRSPFNKNYIFNCSIAVALAIAFLIAYLIISELYKFAMAEGK